MKVLIVDDEQPARERMAGLLGALNYEVCGEAGNGLEALQQVQRLQPDVVMLDVRMPHMDGLEAARHLALLDTPPAVIFTTAFDDYALEAFDAKAAAYLLKPVRSEKLAQVLTGIRSLNRAQLLQLGQTAPAGGARTHLCVKLGKRLELIPLDEVYYFVAEQKYVTVRHRRGEAVIEEPLKDLEAEWEPRFLRIHRRALAAVAHLRGIEKNALGRYQVAFREIPERLEISRRHLPMVRRLVKTL